MIYAAITGTLSPPEQITAKQISAMLLNLIMSGIQSILIRVERFFLKWVKFAFQSVCCGIIKKNNTNVGHISREKRV